MKKLKNLNKKTIIIASLIVLLVAILGLIIYGCYQVLEKNHIYKGVKVEEFDIGLKTKDEALKFLKDKNENKIDGNNMILNYAEKEYNITLRELNFTYNYDKAIEKAYLIGREGTATKRLKEIYKTKQEGIKLNLESSYDKKAIVDVVEKIAQEINVDMVEAALDFNNGNIKVSDEVVGKDVNKEELIESINDNIYALANIDIPVDDIMPSRTKEALSKVNGIIGEFSTSFNGGNVGRAENIRISSNSIKGSLVMPGETFSFNDTTGPREAKFGYKEAGVIVAGELEPGVGGGVCQTSTTLYNALLLSDVTIVERTHHSIPISYVNLGQDAAVAYGYLDLKFKNDFEFPVYIDSKVSGNQVSMYVYGDKNAKDYTVKIKPELIETVSHSEELIQDGTLASGTKQLVQSGRKGYKVNTYKSKIRNGKVISQDLITNDYYRPRNSIYRLGSKSKTIKPVDSTKPEKPEKSHEPDEPEESNEPDKTEETEQLEETEE